MSAKSSEPAQGAAESSSGKGLWIGLLLDGAGGARELDWEAIERWKPEDGALWLNLDPRRPGVRQWLRSISGLTEEALPGLMREMRRSGIKEIGSEGYVLTLRGLGELEDGTAALTPVDIWVEPRRAVTLSPRELPAVAQAAHLCRMGRGPRDVPELLLWLNEWYGDLLDDGVLNLGEPMADLEYAVEAEERRPARQLRQLEVGIARMRRHLTPWRVLVARIARLRDSWLTREQHDRWRDLAVEAHETDELLESLHDRWRAVRASIDTRLTHRTNHILYILTLVSSVMLPLTFLTGIFGMNVGIKGGSFRGLESMFAFAAICVVLVVLALVQILAIRRLRHSGMDRSME